MEKIASNNNPPLENISLASAIYDDENQEEQEDEGTLYDAEEWDLISEMEFSTENDSESEEFEENFTEHFQPSVAPSVASHADLPMHKYPFKLQHNETGNILTVHHTIKNVDKQLRVRIAACCFNGMSNKLLVIDRRGNIYVFDFVIKRYWRLTIRVPQATVVHASPLHHSEYIVGNEKGHVLVINVEKSIISRDNEVGTAAVNQITWGNRVQSSSISNMLMRLGSDAALLNLRNLRVSHRLEFDQSRHTLKLAGYIPNSEQFFTCFTNDSLSVWSAHSQEATQITLPIKARDRKLRLLRNQKAIPEIALRGDDEDDINSIDDLEFDCEEENFADGTLLNYSFTPNGNKLCFTTIDGYLLLLSSASFEVDKLFRMRDFVLKQIEVLPQPKERILFGITARGQAVMLDLENTDQKLIVQHSNGLSLNVSRDGKLLSVLSKCGEVNVWSTCRLFNALQSKTQSIAQLRAVLKQPKLPGHVSGPMNQELRQLLKRDRLEAMLREFGCYPEKYRFIIWSSLLQLPCNGVQYQALLKLGEPPIVKRNARGLRIKGDAQRRGVIRAWSCLAHWCKVFGYAEFMPHLVFPFVKHLLKNGLVVFELMATLLLNHLQLCFEFYPLPPENYLAMCANVLQCNDEQLSKFYQALEVHAKDYAWSLLTNAFAEVLEEQQWLALWDNIITEPQYFIIFVIVAYNLLQRELILRLPDKEAVLRFFHEQNPIDVTKLVGRARKLMNKCPPQVHPRRFMPPFAPIPKGVYPKFLKYPSNWIAEKEEQTLELQKQHQEIDARIRHLELEELQMMDRLQNGLKQEEHTRRVKEMEKLYQETIQREEERISCHRKMLLTYQLEVRQRKSEVMTQLQEAEQRRKVLEMEKDIDMLMHRIERERRRHTQEMQFAEDEIRNQELELLAQRYYSDTAGAPLAQKYYDNIQKMCQERDELQRNLREMTMEHLDKPSRSRRSPAPEEPHLTAIERSIQEIQKEFSDILNSGSKHFSLKEVRNKNEYEK
ncbi:TBC1 domain family member 31 isoform X3 [Drosophila albomicans]|uniref:TBC1 domain family member 31 isoform X3 n=1 Tax=Drosophila albomicans TaxID=7291 RepID=A0A6P8WYI1_DROAB|nr:TBC1 domain family member 31 isoform X3 [Drosophila albomicans]